MSDAKRVTEADSFVGTRIRARRLAIGSTQEKLGAALGVTFQQIQKYEKGANRVGAGRLAKIAEALGCSIMDFYPPGAAGAAEPNSADTFLATREGSRLVRAMLAIPDEKVRLAIIALVEAAAQVE